MKAAFVGKWRILEMDQWDLDYIDMEEPGNVTFKKDGSGGFHFGCVDASLDWRYDHSIDRVDFTFDGSDEGTQVSGRGWAKVEGTGKQMVGQIVFHQGDESGFKAKKRKVNPTQNHDKGFIPISPIPGMNIKTQLADFVTAQDAIYDDVRRELYAGRKETHWIWFIFPQLAGLGLSPMSQKFGLSSKADALAYLGDGVLGPRLRECTELMLKLANRPVDQILGYPDDLKFRSSITLFAAAAPEEPIFEAALEKFFGGKHDPLTIKLLQEAGK